MTSMGVDGPSVPKSLNGVHVYFPPCSFSTYFYYFFLINILIKNLLAHPFEVQRPVQLVVNSGHVVRVEQEPVFFPSDFR